MAHEGIVGPGITTPGGSSPTGETRLSFTRGSIKYDTPFMDMTSTFIPKSIKGLLRFIASSILSDGLVSQCITKLSEYPITKLLYNEEDPTILKDDKTVQKWVDILEKKLKVIKSMKQGGMDYYSYGNSIVSINYPFKRFLKCKNKQCNNKVAAEAVKVKFKNYNFFAKCPKCNREGEMDAEDRNTKELNKLSLIHWDLLQMDIKYNSITDDHFYFYRVPIHIEVAVKRGDMDIVNSTRLEIIEAIKKRKQLKLVADNVFHLKRISPQYIVPSERGWGLPILVPVMKDIFHNKILKKGNEMIAFDHIVPLRILFPQGTGDVSPHATINLSGWKTKVEEEVRKWKVDPNRVSIVPLPLGIVNFSGDAKILSVTPEIKATDDTIIMGIGIIPEIIRGGASWSGSNVSLRVVENSFLNHRTDMHEMLDWIIDNVATYLDIQPINVHMADFKMADDIQKKTLMVNAAKGPPSERIASRTTVTKELGFDPEAEYSLITKELKREIELRIQEQEGAATAQGSATVINALYNADAEAEQKSRLQIRDREEQAKRDKFTRDTDEENADAIIEEVDIAAKKTGVQPQTLSVPNLILLLTQRFSNLAQVDKDEFKIRMLAMKNSMPTVYGMIYNNLKEMNLIQADLTPDLNTAAQYTPGEIPSYSQGETFAEEPPGIAELGPSQNVIKPGYDKPLPESRPPVSSQSPV